MNLKNVQHPEVVVLKIIIMVAILILPLAFMFIDMSQGIIIHPRLAMVNKEASAKVNEGPDFQAGLPENSLGDLSQVPQEKIDSLFSNLKN